MAIKETDIMIISVAAAKILRDTYSMELHDALKRISTEMYQSKDVMVTKAGDNPVERDIVIRSTMELVRMFISLKGEQ